MAARHSTPPRNGTVASRLATVETRVEALLQSVESLTRSVESLTRQIGNVGKMNWPLLVAGLGVLATWTCVIGLVGRMAIEPVEVELRQVQARAVARDQAEQQEREKQQANLRELIELKTRLAVYESRHGRLEASR